MMALDTKILFLEIRNQWHKKTSLFYFI